MSFLDKSKYKENDNFLSSKKSIIISLVVIAVIGFIVRINFVSFELPITLDGLIYFWYAIDMSQSGYFPIGYPDATNNGWPSFLSIFFALYDSNNFLDFMGLQRLVSITISVATIIPIYLLCKRFVPSIFAVFGAGLFVFEPRIIQNSTLGITEPILLLLLTLSIYLFLKNRINFTYLAFAITSLMILIRIEAIFLFMALSIGFFLRHKNNKKDLIKYLICIIILTIILLPMISIRIDTIGEDGILSRILYAIESSSQSAINRGVESGNSNQLIILGFENFVKFFGWVMIPTFLVFVPYGYILVLKNRNFERKFIILCSIIFSVPIIYALSVASDTRYMFTLYPLFCVVSVISLRDFSKRINKEKQLVVIGLIIILASSILYLDDKIDLEHEKEAFEISKIVYSETQRINLYGQEAKFIPVHRFYELESFPIINNNSIPIRLSDYGWPIFGDFDSIDELMTYMKSNDITHFVLDGRNDPKIISDLYKNTDDFIFLEKIYDSSEYEFEYGLKIFKINYKLYEKQK